MSLEKIRLIVADIDGTIRPLKGSPSERTILTIERLMAKGYLFGLASGRPIDDTINKYFDWQMSRQFDFIISWNGAQLYDDRSKKTYECNYLKKEWIKEIMELMSCFDCNINMYDGDAYLSSKETDRAWFSAFKNRRRFVHTENMADFYRHDNGGIMFRVKEEDMPKIEEMAASLKDKDYVGFKTQSDLMEFSHKDANKGNALMRYCQMYDISLAECLAFGDTTNDNSMLKICHGVCLLNGSEDTKSLAEYVTDKDVDHEGFSDFVEKHQLLS